MSRYADPRYAPYLRNRCRTRGRRNTAGIPNHGFLYLLRFLLCMVCAVFALNSFGGRIFTAVENISEYKVAELVNEYIDSGVLKATEPYREKSFVLVGRNSDGKVTSLETDTMEVNRFAASLSESVLREIQSREHEKIKAPLGSLTGNGLLSSFGFLFSYRIIPAGKVTVIPRSSFENAGINQTIHRLKMEVSVSVKILFPLMKRDGEIKRDILVSETVIVGEVPDGLLTWNHSR